MTALETVQRTNAAFQAGDRAALEALMAPDIVWTSSGPAPAGFEARGVGEVADYLLGLQARDEFELTVHELLASDSRVAMLATTVTTIGGETLSTDAIDVIDVDENGLVTRVHAWIWDQQGLAEFLVRAAAQAAD